METKEKKYKITIAATAAILLASLTGDLVLYREAGDAQRMNDRLRLSADSLLGAKQQADRKVFDLGNALAAAEKEKSSLQQQIRSKDSLLAVNEKLIGSLRAQQVNTAALKKQVDALKQENMSLLAQVQELNSRKLQLEQDNQSLSKEITRLGKVNTDLQAELALWKSAGAKASDFRVEMQKKKAMKITAKAKKARAVSVSFDWPEQLKNGTTNVYMVVLDPDGIAFTSSQLNEVTLGGSGQKIKPVVKKTISADGSPQRVTIDAKLGMHAKKSGVYKILIYTDSGLIGSSQVRMN